MAEQSSMLRSELTELLVAVGAVPVLRWQLAHRDQGLLVNVWGQPSSACWPDALRHLADSCLAGRGLPPHHLQQLDAGGYERRCW